MARVAAILRALATAAGRDKRSLGSFAGNNLFVVSLLLLFMNDPGGFVSLNSVVALVLFLPLSGDPLRKAPPERVGAWPLRRSERARLRLLSLGLNPVSWLLAGLALWRGVSLGLWALAAGLFAVGMALPWLPAGGGGIWRWVPAFPGRLGGLIRKNLREILSALDFYAALLLSLGGAGFRAAGRLPEDALLPLSLLVLLAFSTGAQSLFGRDGAGMTRYRLLPMRGWEVLAAKDAAFLLAALVLTLPLAPMAGLGGGLTALAVGHYESVMRRHEETRWRFSSGASFGGSLLAVTLMVLAGAATQRLGAPALAACAAVYAGSTWWFGREIERVRE